MKYFRIFCRRHAVYPRVCGVDRSGDEVNGLVKVYPRVCGVDEFGEKYGVDVRGLSPRVRGR